MVSDKEINLINIKTRLKIDFFIFFPDKKLMKFVVITEVIIKRNQV